MTRARSKDEDDRLNCSPHAMIRVVATFRQPNPLLAYWQRTLRRGRVGAENFLTEFFAAALDTSPRFRSSYVHLVIREHADARGWPRPHQIEKITTANLYPRERPDMVITLRIGNGETKTIWCEHKWAAPEGKTTEPQIVRYLKHAKSHAVVYVRGDERGYDIVKLRKSVSPEIFEKYVVPSSRVVKRRGRSTAKTPLSGGCFVWKDFARVIDARAADKQPQPVVRWLRALFHSDVWRDPVQRRRVIRKDSAADPSRR